MIQNGRPQKDVNHLPAPFCVLLLLFTSEGRACRLRQQDHLREAPELKLCPKDVLLLLPSLLLCPLQPFKVVVPPLEGDSLSRLHPYDTIDSSTSTMELKWIERLPAGRSR